VTSPWRRLSPPYNRRKPMNEHGKTWWEGYNAGHSDALEEARTLCKAIVRAYDDEAHEKFKRPGEFIAGAKSSAAEECEGAIRALIDAPKMP